MRTWLLQAGSNRYFTHNTYSQAVQLLPTCSHPESGHPRVNLTLTGLQKDLSIFGKTLMRPACAGEAERAGGRGVGDRDFLARSHRHSAQECQVFAF